MPRYQVSEKTMAILPDLIAQAGINVPIFKVEETKTHIRFWLYGHHDPVLVRKPAPPKPKTNTGQTKGKKQSPQGAS